MYKYDNTELTKRIENGYKRIMHSKEMCNAKHYDIHRPDVTLEDIQTYGTYDSHPKNVPNTAFTRRLRNINNINKMKVDANLAMEALAKDSGAVGIGKKLFPAPGTEEYKLLNSQLRDNPVFKQQFERLIAQYPAATREQATNKKQMEEELKMEQTRAHTAHLAELKQRAELEKKQIEKQIEKGEEKKQIESALSSEEEEEEEKAEEEKTEISGKIFPEKIEEKIEKIEEKGVPEKIEIPEEIIKIEEKEPKVIEKEKPAIFEKYHEYLDGLEVDVEKGKKQASKRQIKNALGEKAGEVSNDDIEKIQKYLKTLEPKGKGLKRKRRTTKGGNIGSYPNINLGTLLCKKEHNPTPGDIKDLIGNKDAINKDIIEALTKKKEPKKRKTKTTKGEGLKKKKTLEEKKQAKIKRIDNLLKKMNKTKK